MNNGVPIAGANSRIHKATCHFRFYQGTLPNDCLELVLVVITLTPMQVEAFEKGVLWFCIPLSVFVIESAVTEKYRWHRLYLGILKFSFMNKTSYNESNFSR